MSHTFAKPSQAKPSQANSLKLTPLIAALLASFSVFTPQLASADDPLTPDQTSLPDLGASPEKAPLTFDAGPGGLTLGATFARQKLLIAPQYSNETGASLGVTLASMLGEDAAVGVLLNVGADKKEWLLNAGYKIDDHQRVIVTAGQLKQFLDYSFLSGKENVGLTQNSGAISYQLQLGNEFLRFLEVNGYVARTASRDLADKTFTIDTATLFELWNDPRRIAGGHVTGLQGRLGFSPLEGSTVKVSFGHERLSYDLLAGKDSANRLTGGLEWLQQLPNRFQLKVSADTYASQNRYSLGLNRALNGIDGGRHSLGFSVDRIHGRDSLGSDTQYKFLYNYAFGTGNRAAGSRPAADTPLTTPHKPQAPNGTRLAADQMTAAPDIRLLDQVVQRPSVIPAHVVARIDTSALPTRLITIDKTTLPTGTTVNAANGDITTPLGALIASMASVTRNGAPFANSGQFILAGNNLITRPSQIVQPAAGVIDTYVVTFNNVGGGTTLATVLVSHGSVKIDRIAVTHSVTPPAPAVTANDLTNTVTGFDAATMEAALSTDNGATYSAYGALPADLSGDKKLKVRIKAAGMNPFGPDALLSFTTNPVTPPAPAVTADDTANTVTGFDAATMEAALSTDNGATYSAYGVLPADLSGDKKLKVRIKAAGVNPAGPDTVLNFTTNPPLVIDTPSTVTAPAGVASPTSVTETNTITDPDGLRNVVYYLYQADGTTLVASNTTGAAFTGLSSSTAYTMKTTAETYNPAAGVWTLQTSPLGAITTAAPADTTPDAFSFVDQTNVALSTLTESAEIAVAGINAASPISVTGGEYSIDGGGWTMAAGTVSNGQSVKVRHTSSGNNSTATNTVLTIGGVSDTFTTSTVALPAGYIQQGGLTWTPNNLASLMDWPAANTYCSATTFNGQTGWRMPTKDELLSLYESRLLAGQRWTLYYTWSSTPHGAGGHEGVYLNDGIVNWSYDAYNGYVSCVR